MKKIEFINYPKCSTCVKARKWLEEKNIPFENRDIVINNPNKDEIRTYLELSKKDLKKFFNTSGILYREMNLKDKLPKMSQEDMIGILSTNGKLIKRPLLVTEKDVLVGFKEEEWKKYFNL